MKLLLWISLPLTALVLVASVARYLAQPADTHFELEENPGATRLVVIVHGYPGRRAIQPTVDLARDALAPADLLVADYDSRFLSNANAYEIANELEVRIHEAFDEARYASIVLVNYSMGAMILRKSLLWAHGIEEDRVAPKGRRVWAERVERLVSLAGLNRGWSSEPRPENIGLGLFVGLWFGERFATLTGTGKLGLSMRRGAPFIADTRVQWVRLARSQSPDATLDSLPQVIYLVGDHDNIVSRKDAQDVGVAKDTIFVTLASTDHGSIAELPRGEEGDNDARRRGAIRHALRGEIDALTLDNAQAADSLQ